MKREHRIDSFDHIGQLHTLIWSQEEAEGLLPGILFLNGAGERGADPEVLVQQGLPRYLQSGMELPAVVICPQCPAGITWENILFQLDTILENALARYPIDRQRLSLTGLSMGGFGAWSYAIAHPRRFFRVAPICGGGMIWRAALLKNTPIWAFHGDRDQDVPAVYSEMMVEAVNRHGGSARLTLFPETAHNAWDPAYLHTGLLDWLLGMTDKQDEGDTIHG